MALSDMELSEQAFLGSLNHQPAATLAAAALIKPDELCYPRHRAIFEAQIECSRAGENNYFEIKDLIERMRTNGTLERAGGVLYLSGLTVAGSSAENGWRLHLMNVTENNRRRTTISVGEQMIKDAADPAIPLVDTLAVTQEKLFSVRRHKGKAPTVTMADTIAANRERERRILAGEDDGSLSTGLPELDEKIGRIMPGTTTILVGAQSMGKSTAIRSIARELVNQGPGLIYSTEEAPTRWQSKFLSSLMEVNYKKLKTLELTPQQWKEKEQWEDYLIRCNVIMSNIATPTPDDVWADVEAAKARYGIKWVIVDSVSKMSAGKDGIFNDTRAVSGCLQDIALEFDIPVLMTAQLIKDVSTRPNKIPTGFDVQGGQTLSQDADVIIGVYYHDYYVKRGMADPNPEYPENVVLFPILKNRDDDAGDVSCKLYMNPGVGIYPYAAKYTTVSLENY